MLTTLLLLTLLEWISTIIQILFKFHQLSCECLFILSFIIHFALSWALPTFLFFLFHSCKLYVEEPEFAEFFSENPSEFPAS